MGRQMASNDLKLKTKGADELLIKINQEFFLPNEMTMTYKTKVILNPNV